MATFLHKSEAPLMNSEISSIKIPKFYQIIRQKVLMFHGKRTKKLSRETESFEKINAPLV